MTVFAGAQVTLHWNTAVNQYFLLTSNAPDSLPNFSSGSTVVWPSGSNALWDSTWGWWQTSNSQSVKLNIPSNAASGTKYSFQIYTCDSTTSLCSNAPGGGGNSQVTMTVAASNWTRVPYTSDFRYLVTTLQPAGGPTDVSFTTDNTLWVNSEFHNGLGEAIYTPPTHPVSKSGITDRPVPYNTNNTPFAYCFNFNHTTPPPPCTASSGSALGESAIVADNKVWATLGGWEFFPGPITNSSEVIAYDPSTDAYTTYGVPGNDREVVGLTSTGSGPDTTIWFVEQDPMGGHPQLDSFKPSTVQTCSRKFCPLAQAIGFHQYPLPNNWPTEISADPNGSQIWVGTTLGNAVESVDTTTGAVTSFSYPGTNAYDTFYGLPLTYSWQTVADANYVYAADFGDSSLVRIEKAGPNPGEIDVVPLPLNSDRETGFGLALSGSKLYFTTAGGGTLGYVNVAAWEAASSACSPGVNCAPTPASAVEYTGIDVAADSAGGASYGGIAVSSTGQVAFTDYFNKQTIRLVP